MTHRIHKIKYDSELRRICSYILSKAIEAYRTASIVIDDTDPWERPVLMCRFKVTTLITNRELILIRKSHGICRIIESIIDAITEQYEEGYSLHADIAILINEVLNSGEVDHLLTSPTVKALKKKHPAFPVDLPAYWFQHNIATNNTSDSMIEFKSLSECRLSNGYHNRIQFLTHCFNLLND